MKKFNVFSTVMIIVMILVIATLAMAKGPVGETISIRWCEDAIRYNTIGEEIGSWTNDPIPPIDLDPATLVQTGKAYHFADIQEYYNWPLENLGGSLVVSGAGQLSGHATYVSSKSGLPIRDRFKGEVEIIIGDPVGTMIGTYTQWSYAFGTEEEVLYWYPGAIRDEDEEEDPCWWFVGYTEYVAHECE